MNIIRFFLLIIISILVGGLSAQVPQGFKYQAIARDGSGNPLTNTPVNARFTILDGGPSGLSAYIEEHVNIITTNDHGLFSLTLGAGNPVSGTFSAVNWATGSKYLKVEIDIGNGSGYVFMGNEELLSVPFALAAGNSTAPPVTLGQLTDVNITGLVSGQVLQFNGTQWVPTTLQGSNPSLATDTLLSGDGTANDPLTIRHGGARQILYTSSNGSTVFWKTQSFSKGNNGYTTFQPPTNWSIRDYSSNYLVGSSNVILFIQVTSGDDPSTVYFRRVGLTDPDVIIDLNTDRSQLIAVETIGGKIEWKISSSGSPKISLDLVGIGRN